MKQLKINPKHDRQLKRLAKIQERANDDAQMESLAEEIADTIFTNEKGIRIATFEPNYNQSRPRAHDEIDSWDVYKIILAHLRRAELVRSRRKK